MFRTLVLFILLVQFGAASEVIISAVECLANAYRNGTLSRFQFEDTAVIFASVVYVVGGLVYTTLFQEKLLVGFKKYRIAVVIGVLIIAAIEVGYFFQPICQCKKPKSTDVVSRASAVAILKPEAQIRICSEEPSLQHRVQVVNLDPVPEEFAVSVS